MINKLGVEYDSSRIFEVTSLNELYFERDLESVQRFLILDPYGVGKIEFERIVGYKESNSGISGSSMYCVESE